MRRDSASAIGMMEPLVEGKFLRSFLQQLIGAADNRALDRDQVADQFAR
jgi:hypothetical protein